MRVRKKDENKNPYTQTHINCFVARCHPITYVQYICVWKCLCCVHIVFFWAGVAISQSNQKLNFTIMTHLKWFEVEREKVKKNVATSTTWNKHFTEWKLNNWNFTIFIERKFHMKKIFCESTNGQTKNNVIDDKKYINRFNRLYLKQ